MSCSVTWVSVHVRECCLNRTCPLLPWCEAAQLKQSEVAGEAWVKGCSVQAQSTSLPSLHLARAQLKCEVSGCVAMKDTPWACYHSSLCLVPDLLGTSVLCCSAWLRFISDVCVEILLWY